ncbi:hypothetical protein ECANGB1_2219 [Enterospora canceri]|uniref:Uncharacterized protein n=1 Tax=Enterospora canceri TaxID=1081671 RepID=A0A1Y1S8M6_9MICR|nr:hypothetical protein ECANGB1_2219 [Enterospora canceri]
MENLTVKEGRICVFRGGNEFEINGLNINMKASNTSRNTDNKASRPRDVKLVECSNSYIRGSKIFNKNDECIHRLRIPHKIVDGEEKETYWLVFCNSVAYMIHKNTSQSRRLFEYSSGYESHVILDNTLCVLTESLLHLYDLTRDKVVAEFVIASNDHELAIKDTNKSDTNALTSSFETETLFCLKSDVDLDSQPSPQPSPQPDRALATSTFLYLSRDRHVLVKFRLPRHKRASILESRLLLERASGSTTYQIESNKLIQIHEE